MMSKTIVGGALAIIVMGLSTVPGAAQELVSGDLAYPVPVDSAVCLEAARAECMDALTAAGEKCFSGGDQGEFAWGTGGWADHGLDGRTTNCDIGGSGKVTKHEWFYAAGAYSPGYIFKTTPGGGEQQFAYALDCDVISAAISCSTVPGLGYYYIASWSLASVGGSGVERTGAAYQIK